MNLFGDIEETGKDLAAFVDEEESEKDPMSLLLGLRLSSLYLRLKCPFSSIFLSFSFNLVLTLKISSWKRSFLCKSGFRESGNSSSREDTSGVHSCDFKFYAQIARA